MNNEKTGELEIIELKRCSKCREYKPLGEFDKDKYNTYGIQSQCRECKNEGRKSQPSGTYKLWFCGIDENIIEYIGSTKYLNNRKNQHINKLKNNEHHNARLQQHFNLLVKAIGIDKTIKSIRFEKYPISDEVKRYYIGLDRDKDCLSIYIHELERKAIKTRKQEIKNLSLDIILTNSYLM